MNHLEIFIDYRERGEPAVVFKELLRERGRC